jgi:caffeoyl-CoA O-methyltransferase
MQDPRSKTKSDLVASDLRDYIDRHANSPHPHLEVLRENCLEHKWHFMLTTPDQAAFLHAQALLIGAKKMLEIGCYYGHSTLALASALPLDGTLYTIEHNPKFARKAQEHLSTAGVIDRVEFMIAEAPAALKTLQSTHAPESFDLIFIDADKRHLKDYWEIALRLLRPRGLILVDNVLARGAILDESPSADGHIAAVRSFNKFVANDSRVHSMMLSIADGMLLAVKH